MRCYKGLNQRGPTVRRYVTYIRVRPRSSASPALAWKRSSATSSSSCKTIAEVPWEMIGAFQDIGCGADNGRPELQKALAIARKTGAELLVAKLDRLSRKVTHLSALMDDPRSRSGSPRCRTRTSSSFTSTRRSPSRSGFHFDPHQGGARRRRRPWQEAWWRSRQSGGHERGGQGEGRCCGFEGGGRYHSAARSGYDFATDRRSAERHGRRRELVADEGLAGAGAAGLAAAARSCTGKLGNRLREAARAHGRAG